MVCILTVLGGIHDPSSMPTGVVASTSAPATGPAGRIFIFVDRFGTFYIHGKPLELEDLLSGLSKETNKKEEITVGYEAYTLDRDRMTLVNALREKFPKSSIQERLVRRDDGYTGDVFPLHQPSVQKEVLSRRNALWDPLFSRHNQLNDQLRTFWDSASSQMNKILSDLTLLTQETQHLTTRNSGKVSKN